jgi:hypothetical protein
MIFFSGNEPRPQYMLLRLWDVELDLRQLLPTNNNHFHATKEISCLQTDEPVLEILQSFFSYMA